MFRKLTVAAGAAACTLTWATSAQAAAPAVKTTQNITRCVTVDGHSVMNGRTIAEWGKTREGKRYSFTYTAGGTKPAAVPDSTASCSVYISDVSFHGAGASTYFQWETSQVCSGSFGSQQINTQMWRSSWSGPRGYDVWHGSNSTTSSSIDYGWSIDCNDGGGTYTYYPVMKGYASSVGWGPETRSENDLQQNCGTHNP